MSEKTLLPESVTEVLTEESIDTIESALKDKVTLSVEAALAQQDELYAEKLQELVGAIDKDHTSKLERVVEAVDRNNAEKLITVINKYEKDINSSASTFKESLVESISDYLEEFIEESIPADAILEATQNKTAMHVLSNLRQVLAVDSSLMSESVKDAVMDGKTQIDTLSEKLNNVEKENKVLKEAYHKTRANLLIESKTAKLSDKKAEYLRKVLSDKAPKFIEENFEYTAKLFDKKEKERIDVIKEEAFTKRTVKADAPKIVEEKIDTSTSNPYLAELKRMK